MAEERAAQVAGAGEDPTRANLALGLAVAALVAWIALIAADADGPIWMVMGVLAAGAAIVGWSARAGEGLAGRSRTAVIMGVLLFVAFVVGTIVALA